MIDPRNDVYYEYWYECQECVKNTRRGSLVIPKEFSGCTLEVFDWTRVQYVIRGVQIEAKKSYYENKIVRGEEWQILYSLTAGVGKTHLAVASMYAICNQHTMWRGMLVNCLTAFNNLSQSSEKELVDNINRQNIILLDDLGGEPDRKIGLIRGIVHDFHNKGGIVLITTNLTRKGFNDRYFSAMSDRIGQHGNFIEVQGESYRKIKKQSYEERMAAE
jgi:DNA replication protein DnaC